MTELLTRVAGDVVATFGRVWPFLLLSIFAAAAIPVYVGTERISALLNRKVWVATAGAVLLATLTPFCSCGTTAVLLGMLATAVPWAPLVAFMVASPLTSPAELFLSAGLFGWPFALVFFLGTILLGLAAGSAGGVLDRLGWLAGQARVRSQEAECSTGACPVPAASGVGPGAAAVTEFDRPSARRQLGRFGRELWTTGRKLVVFFVGFTAVGYLAIEAIPTDWLTRYLGGDSLLGVPLAALLGIPAYVNTEASLPLVAALMDGGMGPGPAMAFLVTGAGTSIGAVVGLFVIARTRVVALVVGLLFGGAVALGWITSAIL